MFENDKTKKNALREFETKKQNEISRVCHRHYSEFIDSVEELMKMKTDMINIKEQVQKQKQKQK